MQVWNSKLFAKKNGLIMEEWLTVTRQKIYLKCKDLKAKGLIKDVVTKNGDVFAMVPKEGGGSGGSSTGGTGPINPELDKVLVVTDTQFEHLLKRTKGVLDEEEEKEKKEGKKVMLEDKEITNEELVENNSTVS